MPDFFSIISAFASTIPDAFKCVTIHKFKLPSTVKPCPTKTTVMTFIFLMPYVFISNSIETCKTSLSEIYVTCTCDLCLSVP